MKISKASKSQIVNEIEFALKKMTSENDEKKKLYYFSATYGVIQRISNIDYDDTLIFIHFILSSTHANINARIQNPDPVISIPEKLFSSLENATKQLLDAIKNDKSVYESLEKFVLIGYVTTGNGFYLYERGYLKI